jgi:hypothetical protein
VVSVHNNKLTGRLFITIQDESVIRISPFLKGYKKFRDFLLKKHLKTI